MHDQDEAARSVGEGGERSRERRREAGAPCREENWAPEAGDSGYWSGCGGRSAVRVNRIWNVFQGSNP